MKKIGRFNLIQEEICELSCNCGWHIKIGGEKNKDLKKLKLILEIFDNIGEEKNKDCIEHGHDFKLSSGSSWVGFGTVSCKKCGKTNLFS